MKLCSSDNHYTMVKQPIIFLKTLWLEAFHQSNLFANVFKRKNAKVRFKRKSLINLSAENAQMIFSNYIYEILRWRKIAKTVDRASTFSVNFLL